MITFTATHDRQIYAFGVEAAPTPLIDEGLRTWAVRLERRGRSGTLTVRLDPEAADPGRGVLPCDGHCAGWWCERWRAAA